MIALGANVVYGGGDAFNAMVYGEQSPANLTYFQQEVQNISNLGNALTDIGRAFYNNASELYERFNGSAAMRLAKAASRAAVGLFTPDRIAYIQDIGGLQQAQYTMQRWIMANPVVRDLYQQQKCDGYSESYVDVHSGKLGEKHYDYRRVMNGVVVIEEDSWHSKTYCEELLDGDRDLMPEEQVEILSTWSILEGFIAAGNEDPTSPFNTPL